MKKLLLILQNILKVFIIFLLVFIWARYFIRSIWWALLASVVVTLVIDIVTRLISRKKDARSSLKLKEQADAEDMFLSLATGKDSLDFFYKLAKSKYPSVQKKEKYIEISHSEKVKSVLYPLLQFSSLNIDNLTQILSNLKDEKIKKVVIVCGDTDKSTLAFAKNFDYEIIILDKFETYQHLYKPYELFPEISMHYKQAKKLSFKELVAFSFNKSRAKGYLFSAFILLISTMFVRANLYYCIVASLLLFFALLSYSNPYGTNTIKNEVL